MAHYILNAPSTLNFVPDNEDAPYVDMALRAIKASAMLPWYSSNYRDTYHVAMVLHTIQTRTTLPCLFPFTFTYPLTAWVVWAPQMTSQPASSIFLCSPLPSGNWRTLGLSIPWCCFHTSFPVCLVFFPLPLCLTRWFWPGLMIGRNVCTTSVCVSLQWSGGLCAVQLPAGSCRRLPRW